MESGYRFSFGPWNISEGADPFGAPVRASLPFAEKLGVYKRLRFDAVQFHDDDAVPEIERKGPEQIVRQAGEMKKLLDENGLFVEIVAPRLWEDPRGIDGGYTANDPAVRAWAIERSKRCIDAGRALGCNLMVLWLAREGTYIREAKNAIEAYKRIVEAIDILHDYDGQLRIAVEPKPNEPMDQAYVPTTGHALALCSRARHPDRLGCLIETAHAQLAGLDASDEMAFALSMGKLWSVHLNDQNGLKFDQDKTFGSANLRAAWNQVRVLELGGYPGSGACVGLDVKAMRTQPAELATRHLENSKRVFVMLVEKWRSFDRKLEAQYIAAKDYEGLEMEVLKHLLAG